MRAGCVMVVMDLRVPIAAAGGGCNSGSSKGGARATTAAGVLCKKDGGGEEGCGLGELAEVLATAVRQWLLRINLEAELAPGAPVVLQVY